MSYTGRPVRGPTDIKIPKLSLTKSGIWEVDPWQIAPSFSWRHCYPQRHCKENRPITLPPRELTNASSPQRLITELKSRKWCTAFHTGNPGSHAGIGWRLLDVGSHISTKNILAFLTIDCNHWSIYNVLYYRSVTVTRSQKNKQTTTKTLSRIIFLNTR